MKPDHAYMLSHLLPLLDISSQMDDPLPRYLLTMLAQHCQEHAG